MATKVQVVTTNLNTMRVFSKVIDHDAYEDRVWLGRHCFWAMRNNHKVETFPTVDADLGKAGE